jgi:hypothetical protein
MNADSLKYDWSKKIEDWTVDDLEFGDVLVGPPDVEGFKGHTFHYYVLWVTGYYVITLRGNYTMDPVIVHTRLSDDQDAKVKERYKGCTLFKGPMLEWMKWRANRTDYEEKLNEAP